MSRALNRATAVGRAALLALLLSVPRLAAAASVPLRVEVSPATATVGDRITVTLAVDSPAGEPRFADPGKSWGEADVVSAGAAEHAPGGSTWTRKLVLAVFRPGVLELPPPDVKLPDGTAAVPATPIRVEIRAVLPAEPAKVEPKPPAPPVALPLDPAFWWTLALLGGLILAAAGWLVELARRQRAALRPTREIPPFEELEAALAALGPGSPVEPGHAVLSLALRRYVGRSLGFHAAESTTSEIQRELAARRLESALVKGTVQLLRECDGVKFARRPATAAELVRRVALGREFAGAIEAGLRPLAQPGTGPSSAESPGSPA